MTGDSASGENDPRASCPDCGAVLSGGNAGCRRLFEQLLANEYSDPSYGAVHLLCVDAYNLHHPNGQGPRSCTFHLLSLQMALVHDASPAIGRNKSWLQRRMQMVDAVLQLEPPVSMGKVTIADIRGATNPEDYAERVRRWAESVWRTWDIHTMTGRGTGCGSSRRAGSAGIDSALFA